MFQRTRGAGYPARGPAFSGSKPRSARLSRLESRLAARIGRPTRLPHLPSGYTEIVGPRLLLIPLLLALTANAAVPPSRAPAPKAPSAARRWMKTLTLR